MRRKISYCANNTNFKQFNREYWWALDHHQQYFHLRHGWNSGHLSNRCYQIRLTKEAGSGSTTQRNWELCRWLRAGLSIPRRNCTRKKIENAKGIRTAGDRISWQKKFYHWWRWGRAKLLQIATMFAINRKPSNAPVRDIYSKFLIQDGGQLRNAEVFPTALAVRLWRVQWTISPLLKYLSPTHL